MEQRWRRFSSAAAESRTRAVIVCALATLTVVLRAWNLAGHPFPNDDEGTYLAQAWAVRTGLGLSHYTYWYDHPPLGWMQLGALSWLPELMAPERTALVQGRTAMLPVAAVTSVLLYLVARRLGAGVVAAATVVGLNAVSPLAIALQRQVYLDSFAVMWFLASLALALSPKRNLWAHCACGVSFAVAVLSKETIAVLLPALVWALWQGSDRRTRGFSLAAFTAGAAVLLGYPLYSLLKGELFPGGCHSALVGALVWQIGSRGGSGSVFQPGTVANTLVMQWLRADPGLVIGGIVAGFAALALRGVRPLGTAVAFLVLVVCRPGGYLPKMYAVQVVPFLALALVLVVERAVRAGRARYGVQGPVRRTVAAVAVALMAAVLAFGRWPQFREVQRADLNAGYRAAGEWLNGPAVPDKRRARLVTDDVLWLDAVRAGFTPGAGVIWHYKLDKDPAIVASMPHGWRDIDFVLVTPTMREAQAELPTLKALLRHGEPVGDFAYGQIQALRVTGRSAEGAAGAPSVARSLLPCLREADDIWPYE